MSTFLCVRERAAGVWITSERLAVSVPRLLGRERATIIAVVSPGVLVPAWKLVEAVVARRKAARASERRPKPKRKISSSLESDEQTKRAAITHPMLTWLWRKRRYERGRNKRMARVSRFLRLAKELYFVVIDAARGRYRVVRASQSRVVEVRTA